ncbi:4-oxalocrotonate decarboxylase [Shewanella halifaxensis HAW-EB4]|uniref:4-oxalocrotonate decarboxylase n=1 Tax=Shewanella halifaxensis (strain HAW-EB4) TaxID=458817 RepID=B0TTT1_SHEHH|nr:fumarylacetoacetate hydrolase family protein [Shewanella halifaxensis]ABZ76649.1 4-oxalocrotonate decarboxylase [Shewanella halifaxensis HAW-EB4]
MVDKVKATTNSSLIEMHAEELLLALRKGEAITPLSERTTSLTIDDAYQISRLCLQQRENDGEQLIGKKIGVTSLAVQQMLNVHQPDFGFLTNSMHFNNGDCISLSKAKLIQPKAEGEIAFCLKEDLHGPGVTAQDVLDATLWVAPCFEIVDSRIEDWRISIVDTVADNASCGVFVIGDTHTPPREIDLAEAQMEIKKNSQFAGSGLGSAVQGHPAQAVAWLTNTLGEYGIPFKKGEIILSGALAPLIVAQSGDKFTMEIEGLGSCSISFCD